MFEISVLISLAGPLLFNWYGFAQVLFHVNNLFLWGSFLTWLFLGIYVIYMGVAIIFQILLLPKVIEWIETAPVIKNNSQQALEDGLEVTDIDGHPLNDDFLNDDMWDDFF